MMPPSRMAMAGRRAGIIRFAMHLDPTSLRLFISVIEEKTIAAAAQREHIAAAAISKRISELEDTLKTQLLERTNKGIRPTIAGMALSTMARRALRELDEISVSMQEYSTGVRGFIRIFANISVITQFLPQDIKSFANDYPNIQLQLEEKISPAIIKAVYENAADIGIYSGTMAAHEVEVFPYRKDTLALIVPAGHPLIGKSDFHFNDALEYDFVGLHTGSAINQIISKAAAGSNRNISLKVQVTGFDTLCFMVDSGLGLGVLPVEIAKRYARIFDIHILPIAEPWANRQLQICVRSFDALPTAAKLFVNHLSQGRGG
jgi:DNA-binding transcriptional LysR family regulator